MCVSGEEAVLIFSLVMSRLAKWKLEKAKVKVVFRLQFHATHVSQNNTLRYMLMVCVIWRITQSDKLVCFIFIKRFHKQDGTSCSYLSSLLTL